MGNRYVVIGGIAAGMSAASRIKKVDKGAEVIVLEKGEFISYGACSMPYYIANPDGDYKDLIVLTVDDARDKRGIDVRTNHLVLGISPNEKRVFYKELISGKEKSINYDRLVIATGASPVKPPIPGIDNENVFSLRTLNDGVAIKKFIEEKKPKKAVIIGAGYIGLEMAESFKESGLDVTIVEMLEKPMPNYNGEIINSILKTLEGNGVKAYFNTTVERIDNDRVITTSGEFEADIVLLATGVKPNSKLAKDAGIELGVNGAIAVDSKMETSISGIFAAGDCAESIHRITNRKTYVPLGTVANKQGRVAGLNAARELARFPGVIKSAEFKLFDKEVASCGLTLNDALNEGFDPVEIVITASSAAHGYKYKYPIQVAMIGDKKTGKLLGCQMIGKTGVAHRINIVATAIFNGNTVKEFSMFDLAYAPPFSPVWDPVLVAANVLSGKLK
ncbi:NADH oxidase [Thermotomaculum hydrothermale]|uniref:NADH oxidase n=1 Tax=Thermotomaculum hydrothermale TaxID=981385 RepID=A0A7R6PP86_9BACT|nr:FAD-dependent oxidoreductase [Thermotomaculum hydrothermale]BBB32766.1 NADH oxidase [Thermotomaculum hydrothermale]